MSVPLLYLFGVALIICTSVHGGPSYSSTAFDWDNSSPPQQQSLTRRNLENQGGRRTVNDLVRQHISELDKQTQSDLKVLSYMENELNKIFSCYIRLSCSRIRTARVLAECDEIKDWPLYHQVMKMAGIRKYPYQSYAPLPNRRLSLNANPSTFSTDNIVIEDGEASTGNSNDMAVVVVDQDTNATNDNEDTEVNFEQEGRRRRPHHRRFRRGQIAKQME